MKKLMIWQLLALFFAFQSCEEYEMIQYGEGGEINFMSDYYLGQRNPPLWQDETTYLYYNVNFGINPQGERLLLDTVLIGVKISGVTTNYPRKVVFTTIDPEENAVEVIYPEEYYVPADTGVAVFQIVLKRPATRNKEYTANLTFDYEKSDFKAGTLERQIFKLNAEDKATLELWETSDYEWSWYEDYLGVYSEAKLRYLITRYGATSFYQWSMSDEFFMLAFMTGFESDLEEYKADPNNPPFLDENTGEWIDFPF